MTDPLEITLPDADGLEDGDLTIDVMTNVTHILRDGKWCKAGVNDHASARMSVRRWDGIAVSGS